MQLLNTTSASSAVANSDGRCRTNESNARELSSPLFDLCAQIVDMCAVDARDDDRRETITSRLLRNQILQTIIFVFDV